MAVSSVRRIVMIALAWLSAGLSPVAAQEGIDLDSLRKHGVETRVHMTSVERTRTSAVMLNNGGVVEVTSGYLGYVGYGVTAALIQQGYSCRLWIEGHRTYRCDVVRAPRGEGAPARLTFIVDVRADGAILELGTGLYEVPIDTFITSIWCCGEALLINDSRVINLDTADPPVMVTPLR